MLRVIRFITVPQSSEPTADDRTEQLHVRCRPELKQRVDDRAWERRQTISEYVRAIIRADLDGENSTDADD